MKKILIPLFLSIALLVVHPTFAQRTGFCTQQDGNIEPGFTQRDCEANGGTWSATDPNQVPGTIGSGTPPNTNPANGGVDTTAGTIAPTPQASSQQLASCNLISFDSLLDILIWLKCIIGVAIIPLIFTITFLVFLWGMFGYIRDANDVKKREESKKFIYYGIIGLTVMVGVWGIVRIVTTTFGLGNTVPQLETGDCLTTDKNNPCKK